MSNTTATVTAPATADIEVNPTGEAYLRVVVDGELTAFRINLGALTLRRTTVTEEAARLLQRHAGYKPATEWATGDNGHLTATVAEMTGRCTTCVHGCGHGIGDTGCGHYQCPAASAEISHTCDGVTLAVTARRTYPYAPRNRSARKAV
jgi:hypothetical protein